MFKDGRLLIEHVFKTGDESSAHHWCPARAWRPTLVTTEYYDGHLDDQPL